MEKKGTKYKLVVNHVIEGINNGTYRKGDKIPSLNEFRQNYDLSRDTVFAGISELRSKGIIDSTPGVGYFIASTRISFKHHVFLLFNAFKEDLYDSLMDSIGKKATVDIYFYNNNRKVFETLIEEANEKYTIYIIMPGKLEGIEPLLRTLKGRVFLLDHFHPELKGKYSSVFQNFEKDAFEALEYVLPYIRKYKRILMVKEEQEPQEKYGGLWAFCNIYGFGHQYIRLVKDQTIEKGDVYMLVNDRDLVDIIKQAERQSLTPGTDFGIISYNDTPLKEILAGGITTLSTDFKLMGKTMASLIDKKSIETIENPWSLKLRKSL